MPTVFTRIIQGEIPSHTVYKDDLTVAFLDNSPKSLGHTLVVTRLECDKFYDLPKAEYQALFATVQKISRALERVFGTRILAKIIGTEVPHVHVHLIPFDAGYTGKIRKFGDMETKEAAKKIMTTLQSLS